MTCLNLLSVSTLMLALKGIVIGIGSREARSLRFVLSPLLAPNSLSRMRPLSAWPSFLSGALIRVGALLLYYWLFWKAVNAFHLRGLVLSYLAAPAVMLMLEVIVVALTFLWLPGRALLPSPHRSPWLSRSVSDFWGRRWNVWMSDWFRYALFERMRRRPFLAMWLVFLVSGLAHEYVLNLTLWIVTGKALFGTMMVYFLLQGAGVFVERRFLKKDSPGSMLFTWLVVAGPLPLVFHESMLRTLHLWVE